MSKTSIVNLAGRQVIIVREDLLHPFVSGNKFRKLKYNLLQAIEIGASEIISFGGAFSNHIHALAYACQYYQISLVLFIRGEEVSNPTLDYVRSTGAKLYFVDRSTYREIKEQGTFQDFPNAFVVPEGGSNSLALPGIAEMMKELNLTPSNYCVSYGSGATSIGMMQAMDEGDHLHVFSALKMKNFELDFDRRLEELGVEKKKGLSLHSNYHFGGFAKFDNDLIEFINNFEIPLDPIYTGKLFYGIQDLILNDFFDQRPIVAIHTGGLQGIKGFNNRFGNLIH